MRGPPRLVVAVVLGSIASVGCGNEDVVVAQVDAQVDAPVDAPVSAGEACDGGSPCPSGQYCDMPACGAAQGTCQLPPTSCADAGTKPACACNDSVLYWSDCVRQQNSVAASHDCSPQMPPSMCGSGMPPCPPGSFCQEGPVEDCDLPARGACLVLPLTCPSDTPLAFVSCGSPQVCTTDLCVAIRSGRPFQAQISCN
ncbi:MAG: hypothetical protein ACLP1X_25500 [Polyangiaceae bacterium]